MARAARASDRLAWSVVLPFAARRSGLVAPQLFDDFGLRENGTTEAHLRPAVEGAGTAPTSATFVAVGVVVVAVPALNGKVVDAETMFGTGRELAQAPVAKRIVVDNCKVGVGPKSLLALHGSTLTLPAVGIPAEAIDGWSSNLIAPTHITNPMAYDDLTLTTARL